jgi:hypothetical protein
MGSCLGKLYPSNHIAVLQIFLVTIIYLDLLTSTGQVFFCPIEMYCAEIFADIEQNF